MGYIDETIGNLEQEQRMANRLANTQRMLAEKNETANTFMEQVRKLQTDLASALRREEDQILLRHTNNDQHDQTKIKLHEAIDIIRDMVKNLDGADYDRARKFLEASTEASNE